MHTVILALQRYPSPSESDTVAYYTCLIFPAFFALETAVRMLGMGRAYWKDKFNVFDLVVICASFIHLAALQRPSPLTVLRAFRIFKVLMKAKEGSSLRLLLTSVSYTISAIGTFTALLALFIYVYSLLGMQFFAGKLRFEEEGGAYAPDGAFVPRANFDSLLWASVTIF